MGIMMMVVDGETVAVAVAVAVTSSSTHEGRRSLSPHRPPPSHLPPE